MQSEQNGFKVCSILCMPIQNACGQTIGVSQLINKLDRTPFNKNDENIFEVSCCSPLFLCVCVCFFFFFFFFFVCVLNNQKLVYICFLSKCSMKI